MAEIETRAADPSVSSSDSTQSSESPSAAASAAQTETRVDGAHVVGPQTPAPNSEIEAGALLLDEAGYDSGLSEMLERLDADTATEIAEHMQREASQLAAVLRERQQELDRREAQHNAQVAEIDNHVRALRMQLSEREREVVERETRHEQERQEHAQRLADELRQNEEGMTVLARLVAAAEDSVEAALRDKSRCHELQRSLAESLEESAETQWAHAEALKEIEAKHQYLDESEALLNEHLAKLTEERHSFEESRKTFRQEIETQRENLQKRRARLEEDYQKRKEALDQRSDQLDQRSTALDQLETEVSRIHRESLEMRLAAEEVWAEVSEKEPPATLVASMGQARAKIAESYRVAEENLAARRKELIDAGEQLESQCDLLRQQRDQLQEWFARRNEDLEEQAARLVAREQQLDREEERYASLQKQWDDERLAYQSETRRLLSELRRYEKSAA